MKLSLLALPTDRAMDPVITRIGSWIGYEQPILSARIQQIHRSAHDTAAAAIKRAKKWRLLPVFTLLALIASIGMEGHQSFVGISCLNQLKSKQKNCKISVAPCPLKGYVVRLQICQKSRRIVYNTGLQKISLALFAPLALLDSGVTERRLSDFVVIGSGRDRGSKSDAKWRRQRSSLFGGASAKTRDYKLVQTVAVMASSRKVDVIAQDSGAERRDEQTAVLRR